MADPKEQVPVNGVHEESSEEHGVRVAKIDAMRQAGIEPWPLAKPVDATSKDVLDEFKEGTESRVYCVAGRILSLREHGKTAFASIQDRAGALQIYIKKDTIGDEAFAHWSQFVDLGDIVWFSGPSFKTRTGQVTLEVREFTILSKCLHPIPSSFYGIADIETKYRQRYLDLIIDQESRERFFKRSKIVRLMRQFFDAHHFMEVETPMLHPIPGGAVARPFVTHHNALDIELYMRIAPELYLKRLVVGGFDRVYEINRNFRNEGISTRHNPEFTMLEYYAAHKDYVWAMDLAEDLFRRLAQEVNGSLQVPYDETVLDFAKPFVRLRMFDAVKQYANCSDDDLSESNIVAFAKSKGVALKDLDPRLRGQDSGWGFALFALFEELVEPHLVQPTFITHFPVEVSPLAKRNPDDPRVTDRFELFIAKMELANSFNELNDPHDQAQRFQEQAREHSGGDVEAHRYDADYVTALEYALPPTVGFGMGIDRLTMLLTNTTSIKDVILFPTLKRK